MIIMIGATINNDSTIQAASEHGIELIAIERLDTYSTSITSTETTLQI